jgi:hypothetical protein
MSPRPLPAVLLLLLALPALATTMLRMDVPDLTRASAMVVRGKVVRQQSRWSRDGMRIVTDVDVAVQEAVKGRSGASVVRLVQPGGEVGDIGQRVSGVASFRPGEEVVLFLERRQEGVYQLTGMAQGKYRVERSADGRTALAVPESPGDAVLLDVTTQQAVTPRLEALSLEQLLEQVRRSASAAPTEQPGQPAPRGTP